MTILNIIYSIFIMPLQLIFETIYMMAYLVIDNLGLSIIALSLVMNFLVLPLYMRADAMQENERLIEEKLHDGIAHIKKTFKGDEQMMMLQTYYRQNNYKPTDVIKGSVSLFLEIPFFIAAYMFLSHLELLQGVPFGIISDLGAPDALIHIGSFSVNVLPILMTAINLVSCTIFTKGHPMKTKVQLYAMAAFFLVFLYNSPAGLVFYWTLNNLFALVKTIFYKLKNPKKVLCILFACVGVVLIVYGAFIYGAPSIKRHAIIVLIGIICLVPQLVRTLGKRLTWRPKPFNVQPKTSTFIAGGIFLTVLLGGAIPSSVISASAVEFVDLANYLNPNWYVVSSLCIAAGLCLVWFNVFRWLGNDKAKALFDIGIWVLCGIAVLDYMFFGKGLGTISATLAYDSPMLFSTMETVVNLVCIVVVAVVFVLFFKKFVKAPGRIMAIGAIALAVMTGVNVFTISGDVEGLDESAAAMEEQEQPSFTLSTTGQNVVVIMLDRAMGQYIPYFVQENPQLAETFSGFTYYGNTVSFGRSTNFGSPVVYGGYEYTPEASFERDDVSLEEKQNEALRLMPVLFDEAGYDVTVFDPTYAGYSLTPDLSIYDDHPDISAYNAMSYFVDREKGAQVVSQNKSNFFCYAFTRCTPLLVQTSFYNKGNYNRAVTLNQDFNRTGALWSTARGTYASFMNSYNELRNMENMTNIVEGSGSFLMMSNNTTHDTQLQQEPEYEPRMYVDNREYDEANMDRFTYEGRTLEMPNEYNLTHYQTNMAALLELGRWFDYLREQGVYDNTRIIICSDHGFGLHHFADMQIDGRTNAENTNDQFNAESYLPLLMVKDFNATGFTMSDEFMTHADVPTLAFSGVIQNPVNPATGVPVSSAAKNPSDTRIFSSMSWDVTVNNGNTYIDDGIWFRVRDDARVISNWSIISEPAS